MSILGKVFASKKKEAVPTEEEILQNVIAAHDYSSLPPFDYYPRAYEDDTLIQEETVCPCCGQTVPYIYRGRFHGDPGFTQVCPWCIASGAAAMKYHGVFCKIKDHPEIPEEIRKQVGERTPCFEAWKEEQWCTHCGDMAEYLGTAGWPEIEQLGSAELLADLTGFAEEEVSWDGGKVESILQHLDGDGTPRAYVFRCRKCGVMTGYYDNQK